MLAATLIKSMSRSGTRASTRTRAIAQQFMSASTSAAQPEVCSPASSRLVSPTDFSPTDSNQPPVLFESNLAVRTYILNRPQVHNVLDESMLTLLRPKIEVRGTSSNTWFCLMMYSQGMEYFGPVQDNCRD